MASIIKVSSVIIGTMIGAGFASGAEMFSFFFSYGKDGIIGLSVSCLIIGLVIYKSLRIICLYDIGSYKDFLNVLIKVSNSGKWFRLKSFIINFFNVVVNMFILATFFVMVAGFGAYFEQEFGLNSLIGSFILALAVFFTFMKDVKGAVKANEFLVPILVILVILIGVISLYGESVLRLVNSLTNFKDGNFILSGVVYSSYNSILLIPVLITLRKFLIDRRQIFKISVISTFIISILSGVVFLLLTMACDDLTSIQMPVVYVISSKFSILRHVYGIVILGSIYTTAVSLGTSYLQNIAFMGVGGNGFESKIKSRHKSYVSHAVIICAFSVVISKIGFSYLVNLLYPIFGYLGLLQIFKLFFRK